MFQISITAGLDGVFATCPVPALCTFVKGWLSASVFPTAAIDVLDGRVYGVSGFIVPALDPDSNISPDALWDTLVPKDVAVGAGAYDIDTSAADTTSEFEVGEMDLEGLFGYSAGGVEEVFRRRRLLTFPSTGGAGFQAGTPDTYLPSEHFNAVISKPRKRQMHSMLLFGLSYPLMDIVTTDITVAGWRSLQEHRWAWTTYVEVVLERAWAQLQGIIESTAETPWEEAAAFLEDLLEPPVLEVTAGNFNTADNMQIMGEMTFQLSVPGRFRQGSLSSEA